MRLIPEFLKLQMLKWQRKNLHDKWLEDWRYFVTDETMTVEEVNGEFQGLKLPKDVINKIYHDNAVRWFNISSEN